MAFNLVQVSHLENFRSISQGKSLLENSISKRCSKTLTNFLALYRNNIARSTIRDPDPLQRIL